MTEGDGMAGAGDGARRITGTGRDRLTPEQRSRVMAAVKSKGTGPEMRVAAMLDAEGLPYRSHARDLPGSPDFVLDGPRVVVLVDGDFWHGFRFHATREKLSEHWRAKIAANVRRDVRNRKALRAAGWTVVRLWEHSIKRAPARCARRIRAAALAGGERVQAAAAREEARTSAAQSATTRARRQGTAFPT